MLSKQEKERRGALLRTALQGASITHAAAGRLVGASGETIGTWVRGKSWNEGKAQELLRHIGVTDPAAYLDERETSRLPEGPATEDEQQFLFWLRQLDREVQDTLMFVGTWLQVAWLVSPDTYRHERRNLSVFMSGRQKRWPRLVTGGGEPVTET